MNTASPSPYIIVIGSSNTDMVVKAERIPAPGETILGGAFYMNAGGKGANQAVAAARLGGAVMFVANVGNDIFGRQAVQLFQNEGINTDFITVDDRHPSGVALITVDAKGENNIVVASGANAALDAVKAGAAQAAIERAAIIVMQLEIPLDTIMYVASIAAAKGITLMLNPAPACELPLSLLEQVSILTPNETEAALLSGIAVTDMESAEKAAQLIRQKGAKTVIVTLGSKGALVVSEAGTELVPAPNVKAADTTAAGDVFCGALAVALAEGKTLKEAVAFGCQAAALSVTRLGAQASAPYRHEVL